LKHTLQESNGYLERSSLGFEEAAGGGFYERRVKIPELLKKENVGKPSVIKIATPMIG
jgi:hypothetical protein